MHLPDTAQCSAVFPTIINDPGPWCLWESLLVRVLHACYSFFFWRMQSRIPSHCQTISHACGVWVFFKRTRPPLSNANKWRAIHSGFKVNLAWIAALKPFSGVFFGRKSELHHVFHFRLWDSSWEITNLKLTLAPMLSLWLWGVGP